MSKLKNANFSSELLLAEHAQALAKQTSGIASGSLHVKSEVKAPGAIPDLVFYKKIGKHVHYIISIELKLSDWRRALNQSFVHRSFPNETYVGLDRAAIGPALRNVDLFRKANVGLASIDPIEGAIVWTCPKPAVPFSYEFSAVFTKNLLSRKNLPENVPYARSARGKVHLSEMRSTFVNYITDHVEPNRLTPNSTLQPSLDPELPTLPLRSFRLKCS